jgi:nicotinate-nucleotide--dimethylbenzimidazole phosphoribosyltransferase
MTLSDIEIQGADTVLMQQAQTRLDQLTKPQGSLGQLEDVARRVVGMQRSLTPCVARKTIFTLAADHGITAEGVSAYPQTVTAQMVQNFLHGGAGINVLARQVGARIVVVDMGVTGTCDPHPELLIRKIAHGTQNFLHVPAMSYREAAAAINAGRELVADEVQRGVDIIGTGEMGIGNTTSSAAIAHLYTGQPVGDVTGRGTGIDDVMYQHKVVVIEQAIARHQPVISDPIAVLSAVGGFEIAGLVGVILGGAQARIPVVIDGFIAGAAAVLATAMAPAVTDYLIASHCSVEPGHRALLAHMGLRPLLDLDLRLGEGTGAALAIPLVDASCAVFNEMATFTAAAVSESVS